MTPTPHAEQLAGPVRRALDELQLALEPDVFSPATAERSFVVALDAPVVSECLKQAPRIRLSLRPVRHQRL
jgi:DNA-binding transcriptional LysR family regulator